MAERYREGDPVAANKLAKPEGRVSFWRVTLRADVVADGVEPETDTAPGETAFEAWGNSKLSRFPYSQVRCTK